MWWVSNRAGTTQSGISHSSIMGESLVYIASMTCAQIWAIQSGFNNIPCLYDIVLMWNANLHACTPTCMHYVAVTRVSNDIHYRKHCLQVNNESKMYECTSFLFPRGQYLARSKRQDCVSRLYSYIQLHGAYHDLCGACLIKEMR